MTMKAKMKPDLDLSSIQADLITSVCELYSSGTSIRAVAKKTGLSPMKVRKILITGGAYRNDLSTEIDALWKDGKTVFEIASLLNTTVSNVNSLLPYAKIIYGLPEKSVEADRQQRCRDRKKGLIPPAPEAAHVPQAPRVRSRTLIVVLGKKLRRALPAELPDKGSDPLSRAVTYWDEDAWEQRDPAPHIWCAELVTSGRGLNRKTGILLENASCGFAVCLPFPALPAPEEGEKLAEEEVQACRDALAAAVISAIRASLIAFCLPEHRVAQYMDRLVRVEFIKGGQTVPMARLEEHIASLSVPPNSDPVKAFRVRSNFGFRKFGNSPRYRRVDEAVCKVLGMTDEEQKAWLDRFLAPVRGRLEAEGMASGGSGQA